MDERDQEFLKRAEVIADEQITLRDHLQYRWQRAKCIVGRHRYIRGWLGGRVCLFCGRIDTSDPHIEFGTYLMCAVTGISAAVIVSLGIW